MTNILIVLSAADRWTRTDGSIYETGIWAEEFVVMDEAFLGAGFQVDLASPGGAAPTMDRRSLDPAVVGEDLAQRMQSWLAANAARVQSPVVLADVDVARYDAIVIPGGHGPVEDLYKDPDMGRVLVQADRQAKVIAAVCHGPAALLSAVDEQGRWPFAGRRMTALSDEEEVEFGTAENAPWLLADTLRRRGAAYRQAANWSVHVVQDGNLLTGQNPASSAALAEVVIASLR